MKSLVVKLLIVGLLAAVLVTFCTQMMPLTRHFPPPVVQTACQRFCRRPELSICPRWKIWSLK